MLSIIYITIHITIIILWSSMAYTQIFRPLFKKALITQMRGECLADSILLLVPAVSIWGHSLFQVATSLWQYKSPPISAQCKTSLMDNLSSRSFHGAGRNSVRSALCSDNSCFLPFSFTDVTSQESFVLLTPSQCLRPGKPNLKHSRLRDEKNWR